MRALLVVLALLAAACPGGGGKTNQVDHPPLPADDAAPAAAPADAGAPAAAALTAEQEALVDRMVGMTLDLAGKMKAAGTDCAKLAAVVNAWVDANGAEQQKIYDQLGQLPEETAKLAAARAQQKGKENAAAFGGMAATVDQCAESDVEFAKAWSRLEG